MIPRALRLVLLLSVVQNITLILSQTQLGQQKFSFLSSKTCQPVTLPAGTTSIEALLFGGSGGRASSGQIQWGGYGGGIKCVIPVDSTKSYFVCVGDRGGDSTGNNGGFGGWPGGGGGSGEGGGGGGATTLQTSVSFADYASRVVVAGAGGGGGAQQTSGSRGGSGGGLIGGNSGRYPSFTGYTVVGALGGSQVQQNKLLFCLYLFHSFSFILFLGGGGLMPPPEFIKSLTTSLFTRIMLICRLQEELGAEQSINPLTHFQDQMDFWEMEARAMAVLVGEGELVTTEEEGARMLVVQEGRPFALKVDTLCSTTKALQTPNKSMAMPHSLGRATPHFASLPTSHSPRLHFPRPSPPPFQRRIRPSRPQPSHLH